MLNAIFVGIRFVMLVLGGHRYVALENAALRQQLAVFKRDVKRPRLHRRDRLFWIGLRTIWKNWKSALVIVRPETVISWQRKRFKRYWWRLSQAKGPGRPPMSTEIRKLVRTMAAANVLWGAPRIHGELLKLGFEISERTVSRLMPKRRKEPSQTWKTFLNNHVGQLVSIDFLYCSHTAVESLIRIRCASASASPRAAFQCHGAFHRSMDGAADHRIVPRRYCTINA